MASVDLRTVWLSLASDMTQSVTVEVVTQIDLTPQNPGQVRRYASGRFRVVTIGPVQRQVALTFDDVDPVTLAQLLAWDGQVLCYRDDAGQKVYGAYFGPQVTRHQFDANAAVTLTFSEVSYSEAV